MCELESVGKSYELKTCSYYKKLLRQLTTHALMCQEKGKVQRLEDIEAEFAKALRAE